MVTGKVEAGQKTFLPEMLGELWGVLCYHQWYRRAGLEGQILVFEISFDGKMMQHVSRSIFHPSVWLESSPGADLLTYYYHYYYCWFFPQHFMFVGLLFYIPEQDERRIGNSEFPAQSGGRNLEVVIVVIVALHGSTP